MVEAKTNEEILEKLRPNRERILLAIYRHGALRSREIREQAHIPRGSKQHHYDTLQEWGLIEIVDHDKSGGGYPERVFDLTNKGREFVEEYLAEGRERPDSYELRVQRLEDEVDELQTANERLEATVEQQEEHLEDLEDRFEMLVEWMEDQDLL